MHVLTQEERRQREALVHGLPIPRGPTIQEWVEAGYRADAYPPEGYSSRSTQEEIDAAIAAQKSEGPQEPDSQENGQGADDDAGTSGAGAEEPAANAATKEPADGDEEPATEATESDEPGGDAPIYTRDDIARMDRSGVVGLLIDHGVEEPQGTLPALRKRLIEVMFVDL